MQITQVGATDLPELLPLVRAYCDFYQATPSDRELPALSRACRPLGGMVASVSLVLAGSRPMTIQARRFRGARPDRRPLGRPRPSWPARLTTQRRGEVVAVAGEPVGDEHAATPARLSTSSHGMARSLVGFVPAWRGKGVVMMVTAYILVQTEVGKAARVAEDIAAIEGVQQAEDVTGPYDVIVRAEARNIDELGKLVVARVQAVDGITRTLTCPVVHL